MKKFLGILLVLAMVAPSFALTVSVVDNGDGTVDIDYDATGDANQPRAFGIKVTVDAPAFIDGVTAEMTGESTSGTPGFGIFPGTIDVNATTGLVDDAGTPVALAGDPGTDGTGIGTNVVVLELGSLYVGGPNAPDESGTLCTVSIDCNGATVDVNVVVTEEDTFRAGVVLEDGSSVDSPATLTLDPNTITCAPADPNAGTCWDPLECAGQPDGDSTCDGSINLADLFALKAAWFKSAGQAGYNCCADFDHSGTVNLAELFKLKANWFQTGYTPSTSNQTCPAGY